MYGSLYRPDSSDSGNRWLWHHCFIVYRHIRSLNTAVTSLEMRLYSNHGNRWLKRHKCAEYFLTKDLIHQTQDDSASVGYKKLSLPPKMAYHAMERARFAPQPAYRLLWDFSCFSSVPPSERQDNTSIRKDSFLPDLFQFIIHQSVCTWSLLFRPD